MYLNANANTLLESTIHLNSIANTPERVFKCI